MSQKPGEPQRTLLVRCCQLVPAASCQPAVDNKEPQQKASEMEFSSPRLIKHLFSEGDEIREGGRGGGFDINK